MAYDFPSAPTVGQVFAGYMWDGEKWIVTGVVAAADREMLTAPRTYYVNASTGSNTNNGLTSGTAFQTIQRALDVVYGTLDLGGFDVTIQIADGTYTTPWAQTSPQVGAGTITVQGNVATPANVIISTTNASAVRFTGRGTKVVLSSFEIRTTTAGYGLRSTDGASVTFGPGMRLGACATGHLQMDGGGYINTGLAYSIVGNSPYHVYCSGLGQIIANGCAVTISAGLTFATMFAYCEQSLVSYAGATWPGGTTATGLRFTVVQNGVINVGGAGTSFFPGNSVPSGPPYPSGGQYV